MDEQAKKTALLMIPYGLQVLGATDGNKMTLATVNWTTQCSFKPPQVVVGVKGDSSVHALVKNGKVFSLSFLGMGHETSPLPTSSTQSPRAAKWAALLTRPAR